MPQVVKGPIAWHGSHYTHRCCCSQVRDGSRADRLGRLFGRDGCCRSRDRPPVIRRCEWGSKIVDRRW